MQGLFQEGIMVPAVTACQPSPALSLYHGTVSRLALSDRPQGRGMCPQLFLDWLLVGLFLLCSCPLSDDFVGSWT